jgi:hypothetical protein
LPWGRGLGPNGIFSRVHKHPPLFSKDYPAGEKQFHSLMKNDSNFGSKKNGRCRKGAARGFLFFIKLLRLKGLWARTVKAEEGA